MDHIAIDLGGRKSQVCIREQSGVIRHEAKVATEDLKELLTRLPPSYVLMETCAESIAVSDWARTAGHDVRIVAATLVRSLGVGARGIKTDIRDARALSEASCRMPLVSVHMRSRLARERQTQLAMRSNLVSSRTMLINGIKGWLRTQVVRLPTHTPPTFPQAVTERFAAVGGVPACVERQLACIRELSAQIKRADAELRAAAKADELLSRLTTIPGIGPATATCFAAVVDTPERFASSKSLASYVGLTPGEASSSERVQRTSITKAGPSMLRQLLVQCAWRVWNGKDSAMKTWAVAIAERRGVRVAIVALARKLAVTMYALWRDGTIYQPATH